MDREERPSPYLDGRHINRIRPNPDELPAWSCIPDKPEDGEVVCTWSTDSGTTMELAVVKDGVKQTVHLWRHPVSQVKNWLLCIPSEPLPGFRVFCRRCGEGIFDLGIEPGHSAVALTKADPLAVMSLADLKTVAGMENVRYDAEILASDLRAAIRMNRAQKAAPPPPPPSPAQAGKKAK